MQHVEKLQEQLRIAQVKFEKCYNDNDSDCMTSALERLVEVYVELQDWPAALQCEEQLEELIPSLEMADCYQRQGKIYMRMGQFAQATRLYNQAMELMDQMGQNRGHLLVSMAGPYFYRERFDQALEHLEEAEKLFDRKMDSEGLVKCWQHMGLVYRTLQDFESALTYYQQALEVATRIEDRQKLRMDVADVLVVVDQPQEAMEMYQLVLDEAEEELTKAIMFQNLGQINASMEQYKQAEAELEMALELKQRLLGETDPQLRQTLSSLGAVYAAQGEDDDEYKRKAMDCFQQALLLARMHSEDENDPDMVLAMRNIARLEGQEVPKWGSTDR